MRTDEQKYLKGRGAVTSPANRFQPRRRETFDDGWYLQQTESAPQTVPLRDSSRTIIARNQSPDIPFSQSVNPYRGCEHGCIYCYARPTHAWLDLSPGLDFETKILYKPEAAELLQKEFAKKSYVCQPLAMGTNTDPYQPLEREFRITRSILDVCLACRHPVTLITKSSLILRDLDLLQQLSRHNLCRVAVSVTTLSKDLKRRLEPRTAAPAGRLRTIKELTAAGVPVAVMAAPMIPRINDHELEAILEQAKAAGAVHAGYVFLRLPLEVAPMFRAWLEEHFPQRAEHVMSIVQQSRGGRDYDARFGVRMRGQGVFADLLQQRFVLATRKLGLRKNGLEGLSTHEFRPPPQNPGQMSML